MKCGEQSRERGGHLTNAGAMRREHGLQTVMRSGPGGFDMVSLLSPQEPDRISINSSLSHD